MTDPNHPAYKIYSGVLQFSVLLFTLALVYFAFVYYPRVTSEFKSGKVGVTQPVVAPVVATAESFPVTTNNYRLTYERDSNTYYAFVEGETLDRYMLNRNSAKLTLKNLLSEDSLCGFNVFYLTNANLEIPQEYLDDADCS